MLECDTCQCNTGKTVKTPGILQLLPLPPTIWTNISMNFIIGLPKSGNKLVIMLVMDNISKYVHFWAL
jgi:hypothetical protein